MPYQSTEWGWSFLCKLVRGVLRNHKKYFMYTDHCEAFCFKRCSSFVGHLGVSGQKLWLYEYGCVFVSIKILYDMRYLIYVDLRNKIKYNNFKQRSIILRLYNGVCDTSHNHKRKRNIWLQLDVALHEMLHAAGAMHEQSREDDRDRTITLNWDSIPRQLEMNYRGYKTANAREYDLGSMLQYPLKVRISCQKS